MVIYTIGYGNRPIGTFLDLLRHYSIGCLVDVRSLPTSRFRPDFRKKALQQHLEAAGMEYWWMGENLGGKRVDPSCIVDGKVDLARLAALPAFRDAMDEVVSKALAASDGRALALMCSEQKPENCHRAWWLAPEMAARGLEVLHIDENGALKTQQEVRGFFADA